MPIGISFLLVGAAAICAILTRMGRCPAGLSRLLLAIALLLQLGR